MLYVVSDTEEKQEKKKKRTTVRRPRNDNGGTARPEWIGDTWPKDLKIIIYLL